MTIKFLANSLSKIHEPVAPYPLCKYFLLSLFFTVLVAQNKKFLNLKISAGFLGQASKP